MEPRSFLYSSYPEELGKYTSPSGSTSADRWKHFSYRSTANKTDTGSETSSLYTASRGDFRPKDQVSTSVYYKNLNKGTDLKRRASLSSSRPTQHLASNIVYPPKTSNSRCFASFVEPDKTRTEAENCSPRVHNLQKEMDLLRTEIQRLKAIDINTYSTTRTRYTTSKSGHSSEKVKEHTKWTISTNNNDAKTKPRDKEDIRDAEVVHSEDSEIEYAQSDDFKNFVERLKNERTQLVNQSSGSSSSDALETYHLSSKSHNLRPEASIGSHSAHSAVEFNHDQNELNLKSPNEVQCFESSVQTDERECEECKEVKLRVAETEGVVYRQQQDLHFLKDALRRKDSELREWEEKCLEYEKQIDVGVDRGQKQTVAVQCDEQSVRNLIDSGCQSDKTIDTFQLQSKLKAAEDECNELVNIVEELKTDNEYLREENHAIRVTETSAADQQLCTESLEDATYFCSSYIAKHIERILEDQGISQTTVTEIINQLSHFQSLSSSQIDAGMNTDSTPDDSLTEKIHHLEAELKTLQSTHYTELQYLNQEKESLVQKIVELRKLIKKETAEKEAALNASAKHEASIRDQYAEVEQSRVLVQQKKEQISELEDTLAMLQHENENWERDYSILVRKNEKLERELQLARKLESNFNQAIQDQT